MLKLISLIVSMLAALAGSAQADIVSDDRFYSNQTPYGNPAATSIRTPPPGYELTFLQTVARHGSRSQTSNDAEQRALAVWSAAAKKGQLTTAGKLFDDDVRKLQAAEVSIGYARLSAIGRAEWQGIGRRTAANYHEFLTKAAADGDDITFKTTSLYRTKQSATSLRLGLDAAIPGLDLKPWTIDDRMRITSGSTTAGRAAIASVHRRSDVRSAARHVLRQLYTAKYVDSLSGQVAKALDIYALYTIAPGMKGETPVTFSRYVPLTDARLMGYAKDAQNFYRYGPGVKGQTSSYRQARPILLDFFSQLDKRLAGGTKAAVFRLAHGETTMPFAAVSKMPRSTKQASVSAPYSYGNNTWRGYIAGRMAGNIEWAAYRNARGGVLVTIRYNEQPVRLHSSCTPSTADPYFYRVSALKRCLL
ncbi:histidine-type phosphatase [Aeromicrobium sp.]|uniref:histidine-type phosphatase n=1 Tax=Aeromicrobium sp. TaxID=1871063 RepID=UPI002FC8A8C5